MSDRLTPATIEGLRGSVAKDQEAARLLDCAASYVERGWTRDTFARDAQDEYVLPKSSNATCWSAEGAMEAAAFKLDMRSDDVPVDPRIMKRVRCAFLLAAANGDEKQARSVSIERWNDTRAGSGAQVAQTMRTAAKQIHLRIEKVQRGIAEAES